MPRLILQVGPGIQAASVQASVQALPFVRDARPSRTANVVVVDVPQATTDIREQLADQPGVTAIFDDIQAVPQVAEEREVEDFLDRVRDLRGEEDVPPLLETDPLRTDGGAAAIPPAGATPEAAPAPQLGGIRSIDGSLDFTGAVAAHEAGRLGEGVIAVVVDTGASASAIREDRQLDGSDLSGEGDPWSLLSPHGGMTMGIMAGDETTPGIDVGYAPATDVWPIKTTLAASEIIQAQDIIVTLADRMERPVLVNNCLTADAMVSTTEGPKPIVDVQVGDRVFACDLDVRGQQVCEVTDTFESGEKQVYDLQTRTRSVRASANHPFLVADQEQERLVWKALEDVEPGDLVAIRRSSTGAGKPHSFVTADGGQLTLTSEQGSIRQDGRTSSKGCTFPRETTEAFCRVLGALYGDGSVTYSTSNKNRVMFTANLDKYPEMRYYVEEFERMFGVEWIERPRDEQGAATTFVVNNKPLADFLHGLGLRVGKDRTLPSWLYSLPEAQKLGFLRGYLDADGHVDKRGHIYVRTTHGAMARELWELFVSAGIKVSRVKEQVQDIEVKPSGKFYPDHEVFHFTASSLADNRRIGSALPLYCERLDQERERPMYYGYVGHWTPEIEGFAFDRVVSIEPKGAEPTYDIEVGGAHNFVANGMLLHNSWGFTDCVGLCGHPVTTAIDNASRHPGVIQVFAAGNQGGEALSACGAACDGSTPGINGPNSLDSVITVGATGLNGDPREMQPYSSRGGPGAVACGRRKPDLVAPIFGTVPWGSGSRDIGNGGGTSAACPQVAGTVALLAGSSRSVSTMAATRTLDVSARQFIGEGFNGCSGAGNLQALEATEGPLAGAFAQTSAVAAAGLAAGLLGAIARRRLS